MKKTYITTMPDHIGSFLKASECFASLGVNITRVSYNKAIDTHTLFIDAEGDEVQLSKADEELGKIGYLLSEKNENSIVLLEFMLKDIPGSVTKVLRLIHDYSLNISYISSQENGSGYQAFKMGLFVDNEERLKEFLDESQKICPVQVLDYNRSERVFDNSIFYQSFVSGIMSLMGLPEESRDVLLVNSNLVMQMLDEKGLSPFKTFESISKFAELLSKCRKEEFKPRMTRHDITENTEIILIEPACGSNTAIIKSNDEILFIDSGYALYREEMTELFKKYIPKFEEINKKIFVTHADVDHCGLLSLFDEIYASRKTKECLELEFKGDNGYREQNPLHRPYVNICKEVTFYKPVNPDKIRALWDVEKEQEIPLAQMGTFDIGEMHFEVFQGKGGHLQGETVLIDYDNHVAFTGDIYVNIHGMTREQAEYNKYAPVLMTSVDTDPEMCAKERKNFFQRLGEGDWKIFGAHGEMKEYRLHID